MLIFRVPIYIFGILYNNRIMRCTWFPKVRIPLNCASFRRPMSPIPLTVSEWPIDLRGLAAGKKAAWGVRTRTNMRQQERASGERARVGKLKILGLLSRSLGSSLSVWSGLSFFPLFLSNTHWPTTETFGKFQAQSMEIKVSNAAFVLGGAATCSKGFVNCFLRVPQAVGQYCTALPCCPSKQGEFLENILQNLRNKWPPHPVDTSGIETWVKAAVIELLYLGTDSGRRRNTKLTLGRPPPPSLLVFLSGQKQ